MDDHWVKFGDEWWKPTDIRGPHLRFPLPFKLPFRICADFSAIAMPDVEIGMFDREELACESYHCYVYAEKDAVTEALGTLNLFMPLMGLLQDCLYPWLKSPYFRHHATVCGRTGRKIG